ncbi:MAG: hypothetical protein WED07_11710 [Candidatus Freyarchaeum deiterrae]
MSSKPCYMLMLQIERGDKVPIPFRQENLSDDKIIALIDESKSSLYLWVGKDSSDVNKRSATRTAQSIKKSGFSYGQLHIGHDLKDLKVVDASNPDDPETRNNQSELTAIFRRKFTKKDQFVMEIGAKPQAAPAVPPVEKEAYTPKPEPKIIAPKKPASVPKPVFVSEPEPIAEEVEPTPEPVATPKPVIREELPSAVDPELVGQVKLGLLTTILATKFSGYVFKSTLSSDGKPIYEFSSSGGSLCKVSLEGSDLIIFPDSRFGGMREDIVKMLKSKVSSLKL